jgi:2,3-bisphosphoglycerate-independent phosphoglycerate mutase
MRKNSRCPMSDAVAAAYEKGEDDETLEPLVAVNGRGAPIGRFEPGDSVVFYDIRVEREVELTRSLVEKSFAHFPVKKGLMLNFLTMIEYDKRLPVRVAFPSEKEIDDTLCSVLDKNKLRFARIVESDKAIHLTYFLDGKTQRIFSNEERIIVPSLKDNPIDKPEMRIKDVVAAILEKQDDEKIDVIIANLANVDVVGHSENKKAILRAVEAVDRAVGKVAKNAIKNDVALIITADHGTVEKWLYPDGTIDTGHTSSPVPFVLVDPLVGKRTRLRNGCITDVAPTLFRILGLRKPVSMTGKSLIADGYPATKTKKRACLLILDGWGLGKRDKGDLIYQAKTPNMDRLWKNYPHATLKASGSAVGMPDGSVGNSESGHLHIGAGRCIDSDKWKIDKAIRDGSFFDNKKIIVVMDAARKKGKKLHLLGIVSFYSSHGSVDHLKALIKMAKARGLKGVYIHSFLGRRGEKAESGARYIRDIEKYARKRGTGKVVSVIGRHWSLDREENWDRIEKTYRLLVYGDGMAVKVLD